MVTPDGELSLSKNNTLVISVVNIAEEGSIANRSEYRRGNDGLTKQSPPVYLNIYILLTAVFKEDEYTQGLHWLSLAIGFFQQHPLFTAMEYEMPTDVDRLNFELINIDLDLMSRFWGALGARYQPSVIYKMRMLKIDDNSIKAILPEIKEPKVT